MNFRFFVLILSLGICSSSCLTEKNGIFLVITCLITEGYISQSEIHKSVRVIDNSESNEQTKQSIKNLLNDKENECYKENIAIINRFFRDNALWKFCSESGDKLAEELNSEIYKKAKNILSTKYHLNDSEYDKSHVEKTKTYEAKNKLLASTCRQKQTQIPPFIKDPNSHSLNDDSLARLKYHKTIGTAKILTEFWFIPNEEVTDSMDNIAIRLNKLTEKTAKKDGSSMDRFKKKILDLISI